MKNIRVLVKQLTLYSQRVIPFLIIMVTLQSLLSLAHFALSWKFKSLYLILWINLPLLRESLPLRLFGSFCPSPLSRYCTSLLIVPSPNTIHYALINPLIKHQESNTLLISSLRNRFKHTYHWQGFSNRNPIHFVTMGISFFLQRHYIPLNIFATPSNQRLTPPFHHSLEW